MKQNITYKYRRPLMRAFFLFSLVINLSCSLLKHKESELIIDETKIPQMTNMDYRDHISSLSQALLDNPQIKLIKLKPRMEWYLNDIFNRVVSNNELLLKKEVEFKPQFFVIKHEMPFIFSLPKNQFFISKGLIKKYFKNEAMFVAALVFEIVKSKSEIYYKTQIIPTGVMDIRRIISLVRIGLEDKMKIYKWTYFTLRRAEYDASAILNWIQIQNKNTLDFSWMIGDSRVVTREEFEFKNFLASRGVTNTEIPTENSSKDFYYLKDRI
jgi:hypothetical protein